LIGQPDDCPDQFENICHGRKHRAISRVDASRIEFTVATGSAWLPLMADRGGTKCADAYPLELTTAL
jgi:hypothetical protein